MDRDTAQSLMDEFAERTGISSERAPNRYLWTDAFAVCNFVGLARELEEPRHLERARDLVAQVHDVLGTHREDDPRDGRISGLDGADAEEHPTAGGLRIGKPRPERSEGEDYDARAEWDRDGQYFHYLTKWMHALDVMARATGEPKYHHWSLELAEVAYDAFTYRRSSTGPRAMYWKMSIDLSRPQVPTMGQHDPLDGLVTAAQLMDTARSEGAGAEDRERLGDLVDGYLEMLEGRDLTTDDSLGLGGLLMHASKVAQLGPHAPFAAREWVDSLVDASARGLQRYTRGRPLERPARNRLAFRELGLAIGLQGVELCRDTLEQQVDSAGSLEVVVAHQHLWGTVVRFWLDPVSRQEASWAEHRDINQVMLATALSPEGLVSLD